MNKINETRIGTNDELVKEMHMLTGIGLEDYTRIIHSVKSLEAASEFEIRPQKYFAVLTRQC